eukprot:gene7927-10760_t
MNTSSGIVDVWVGGDGGTWSCSPSVLYKIPTDIFDYNMMLGCLQTQEDLSALMEKLHYEKIICNEDNCTQVHVSSGGVWSGLPSIHFQIPVDVFDYLQQQNGGKLIGRLNTQNDLLILIDKVRNEIMTGIVVDEPNESMVRSKPQNSEIKDCGHACTASSVKSGCCKCEDLRPIRDDNTYVCYVDGKGWVEEASRGAGYCPFCYF